MVVSAMCFALHFGMSLAAVFMGPQNNEWIDQNLWYFLDYWIPTIPPACLMLFLMRNVHRGDLEESSRSSADGGLLGRNRYRDDSRSSGSGGSTTSHAGSYVVVDASDSASKLSLSLSLLSPSCCVYGVTRSYPPPSLSLSLSLPRACARSYDTMRGEFSWRDRESSAATGGVRRETFEVDRSRSGAARESLAREQDSFYSRRGSDSDTLDDSGMHSRDQSFATDS